MTQGAQQILIDSIPSIAMVQMIPAVMKAPLEISKIYDEIGKPKKQEIKNRKRYKKPRVK